MRPWQYAFILATILAAACGSRRPVPSESPSLTAAQTATVQANVRTFAQAVAHDVTQDGPGAWRKHFSQSPSFLHGGGRSHGVSESRIRNRGNTRFCAHCPANRADVGR